MSKMTDLMDMYLAMRETGSSSKDAYTVLDMVGHQEVVKEIIISENEIEIDLRIIISDLELKVEDLNHKLFDIQREKINLLNEISSIRTDMESITKLQEEIETGNEDPQKCKSRINNAITRISKRYEQNLASIDVDREIAELNKANLLAIRAKSFRLQNHETTEKWQKDTVII